MTITFHLYFIFVFTVYSYISLLANTSSFCPGIFQTQLLFQEYPFGCYVYLGL